METKTFLPSPTYKRRRLPRHSPQDYLTGEKIRRIANPPARFGTESDQSAVFVPHSGVVRTDLSISSTSRTNRVRCRTSTSQRMSWHASTCTVFTAANVALAVCHDVAHSLAWSRAALSQPWTAPAQHAAATAAAADESRDADPRSCHASRNRG